MNVYSIIVNLLIFLIFKYKLIGVNSLKCVCNKSECDKINSYECPGRGTTVLDPCKCCRVCAKTLGEPCGGQGGFSGACEKNLYCISKPPVTEPGICLELPKNTSQSKCWEQITIYPGCEIVNRECKCWGVTYQCRNSLRRKYDFRNFKECRLNLQILIQSEIEFDEDFTVPNTINVDDGGGDW